MVKNMKSQEQHQKELEKEYPKKKHNKSMQDYIQEARTEVGHHQRFQERMEQGCAYCNSQRDHFVPIEYSTGAFTYQSIEDADTEVICSNPSTIQTDHASKTDEPENIIKHKWNLKNKKLSWARNL